MKCEHVGDHLCGVRNGDSCPYYDREGCYYNPETDKRKDNRLEKLASLMDSTANDFYAGKIEDDIFIATALTIGFSAMDVSPGEAQAMMNTRGHLRTAKKIAEFDTSKLK